MQYCSESTIWNMLRFTDFVTDGISHQLNRPNTRIALACGFEKARREQGKFAKDFMPHRQEGGSSHIKVLARSLFGFSNSYAYILFRSNAKSEVRLEERLIV